MPTDENVNASQQTEQSPPATVEITDDLLKTIPLERLAKAHPEVADLKEKHAAARQGMDKANLKLKKIKSEDDESEPDSTLKDELKNEVVWEIKNENTISLANKNGLYDKYVAEGKTRQDALKLALFDEGITNSAAKSESMRQAQASSPTPGIDRSSAEEATAEEKLQMEQWGYSLDTLRKHKAMRQR